MSGINNELLVGSTGFVGGNLLLSHSFHQAVHSSDISNAFGSSPDLCVYAGVPSAMFLANQNPRADLAIMEDARKNLQLIKPKKVVLISSIAVYDDSRGKDELSPIDDSRLLPYGKNRLQLERWVREDHEGALVVRLPALFGKGIKKNFIKDLISITPALLTEAKYAEFEGSSELVRNSYSPRGDGYYAVSKDAPTAKLKEWFLNNDFNALSFTDSRSRFQFFDLGSLWDAIERALCEDIGTLNLATPPVSAGELYRFVRGTSWSNELASAPYDYDMRTRYFSTNEGESGYICTLEQELNAVKDFVAEEESCQN